MEINGTLFSYYHICHRKLWYFSKHIGFEEDNSDVKIGKLIDEDSFRREQKNIMVDSHFEIDFIDGKSTLHEIKKSKALEESHVEQCKFYAYKLMKQDIQIKKILIHYPLLKETRDVAISEIDFEIMESKIKEIEEILALDTPPLKISKKSICKKCAYYEFCYI